MTTFSHALACLRALAEKATPGEWFPWNAYPCGGGIHPQSGDCIHVARIGPVEVDESIGIVADNGRVDMHGRRADFEYIAAANPKAILELLAELEQREAALEKIETSIKALGHTPTMIVLKAILELLAELEQREAALEKIETSIKALGHTPTMIVLRDISRACREGRA